MMLRHFIRLLLIALLVIGSNLSGLGQNDRPGFLVTSDGDTVSGLIRTVMWKNDPHRINHFVITQADGSESSREAKQVTLYVDGALPPDTKHNGTYYHAKVYPHNGLRMFIEPRVIGKSELYIVPDPQQIMVGKEANRVVFDAKYEDPREDAYYVSSAGSELLIRLEPTNYELVLKQVLRDCPGLTEQIGKKKFRFRNLESIITYYNESCE